MKGIEGHCQSTDEETFESRSNITLRLSGSLTQPTKEARSWRVRSKRLLLNCACEKQMLTRLSHNEEGSHEVASHLAQTLFRRGALLLQFISKCPFLLGHKTFVPIRIDKRRGQASLEAFILRFHIEVTSMGAKKQVTRQ